MMMIYLSSLQVEYTSATRTEEKTKAVGLITIKTKVDNREYSITGAFDAGKGEKVDYDESLKRGIISEDASTFKNTSSNEVLIRLVLINVYTITKSKHDSFLNKVL